MKKGTKILALLMAVVLLVGATIFGTMAYLTDKTAEIKNTFTVGNIDITLKESDDLDLKMVPGCTITKDPKVTVKAGSEKCWQFVEVVESDKFDTFMTYVVDCTDGNWMQGDGTNIPANVYYRTVDASASASDQSFTVIKDNEVRVKDTVTKNDMNTLTANPTLTFTAYACQFTKGNGDFTAAEAWEQINPTT